MDPGLALELGADAKRSMSDLRIGIGCGSATSLQSEDEPADRSDDPTLPIGQFPFRGMRRSEPAQRFLPWRTGRRASSFRHFDAPTGPARESACRVLLSIQKSAGFRMRGRLAPG